MHNDPWHPKCQNHACCIGHNAITCKAIGYETPAHIRWLAESATLVYIALKLSKIDPQDPLFRACIMCQSPIGTDSDVRAHKEDCAWRQAKEFINGSDARQEHT